MYEHTLRISFDARPEVKDLELRGRVYDELAAPLAGLDKHPSSTEHDPVYALTERTCQQLAALLPKVRRHKLGQVASGRLETALECSPRRHGGHGEESQ